MTDPFTALGIACNIIQFVWWGTQLVSKGQAIYKSADGALDENIDLKVVTTDFAAINAKLNASATSTADTALIDLCKRCAKASDQLLAALKRLDIKGKKTRWKSMRAALKSVWNKEGIDDMRCRLEEFRQELTARIVIDLRLQIDLITVRQTEQFATLDSTTKAVLDAIIESRDVFDDSIVAKMGDIKTMHIHTQSIIVAEHLNTRTEILTAVESSSDQDYLNHENTREEILQLREAVEQYRLEMAVRTEELRTLLIAFNDTQDAKKRDKLRERSNAVTAALLALRTMYDSLLAFLGNLQIQTQDLFSNSSKMPWKLPSTYRTLSASGFSRIEADDTPDSYKGTIAKAKAIGPYYSYHYTATYFKGNLRDIFSTDGPGFWWKPPQSYAEATELLESQGDSLDETAREEILALLFFFVNGYPRNKSRGPLERFALRAAAIVSLFNHVYPSEELACDAFQDIMGMMVAARGIPQTSMATVFKIRLQQDVKSWLGLAKVSGIFSFHKILIQSRLEHLGISYNSFWPIDEDGIWRIKILISWFEEAATTEVRGAELRRLELASAHPTGNMRLHISVDPSKPLPHEIQANKKPKAEGISPNKMTERALARKALAKRQGYSIDVILPPERESQARPSDICGDGPDITAWLSEVTDVKANVTIRASLMWSYSIITSSRAAVYIAADALREVGFTLDIAAEDTKHNSEGVLESCYSFEKA